MFACGGLGTISLDLATTVIAGLRSRNFLPPAGWESDANSSTEKKRIAAAIAELGYTRALEPATTAAHHRRSGFATWVFQPASTGRFPAKAPRPSRSVLSSGTSTGRSEGATRTSRRR
ncbi:hypothetical protein GCM10009827_039220 [Dactylosporangium maewongense]|uniref:Uncharacterized protein n=1 Tax=Dactylosporangium maewongense TaxID=634393 RepID=A0ABN2AHX6_9ACTN